MRPAEASNINDEHGSTIEFDPNIQETYINLMHLIMHHGPVHISYLEFRNYYPVPIGQDAGRV